MQEPTVTLPIRTYNELVRALVAARCYRQFQLSEYKLTETKERLADWQHDFDAWLDLHIDLTHCL